MWESAYLGNISFSQADQLQRELAARVRFNGCKYILGLEHPTVITSGRRYKSDSCRSSEIVNTDRGGLLTLHSPGQLVVYPILSLSACGLSVKEYVCMLLKSAQVILRDLGIQTYIPNHDSGIFTSQGKIAFCGIRVEHGVTRHGISINLNNDLRLFEKIIPCGNEKMTLDKVGHYISLTSEEFFIRYSKQLRIYLQG